VKKNYYGPWMQFIDIIEKFYNDINQVLGTNDIQYLDFTLSALNLENDLNEDLDSLISYIKSITAHIGKVSLNKVVQQIESLANSFRRDIHRQELLLVLAAYRREDGLPLLDFFNKIEVEEGFDENKLCCISRTRKEFVQQLMGDGSFLASYYKV
jgi:hypothetical protein